jgi:diaminohydroxyphosphoribosylaminopyrimidine deaminase/5-amino-6-(5-phosphoribosylamino)uracil reductase
LSDRDTIAATAGPEDGWFMARAVELAARGLGMTSPNPLVGAVVVAGGRVIGEGWHDGPGPAHAEIAALRQAGADAAGATLYVTLEPCAHHGRTPPCAPAVARAGIARVVAATGDPFPEVDGRGFRVLSEAGVDVVAGVLAAEAERQNAGFLKHVRTGLPFVTLKMAASLDGKAAARDGSSRWITGQGAREDVHRLRAAVDAVVVGAGTAAADDPSLTVRLAGYRGRQPRRVVVDGGGRTAPTAKLFDGTAPAIVATTPAAPASARAAWDAAGAEVLVLAAEDGGSGVRLPALMEALGEREVQSVLIEGGPTLAWSAIRDGVVDRLVAYLAPKLVGGAAALGLLGGAGVGSIGAAVPLEFESVDRIGADLRIVARPAGRG